MNTKLANLLAALFLGLPYSVTYPSPRMATSSVRTGNFRLDLASFPMLSERLGAFSRRQ